MDACRFSIGQLLVRYRTRQEHLYRSLEELPGPMLECAASSRVPLDGRKVAMSPTLLFVIDMTFALDRAQDGQHGGVGQLPSD